MPPVHPAHEEYSVHDLLGIISDTHGHADRARKAVEALRAHGATHIIHLGDVGSEAVLDHLVGMPATVVFGNGDDHRGLTRYAEFLGINVAHPATVMEAKSIKIGITHGHIDTEIFNLMEQDVDVLLHGHTHQKRDERIGSTRVMNPGAVHGAEQFSVLLYEPATGTATWLHIEDGPATNPKSGVKVAEVRTVRPVRRVKQATPSPAPKAIRTVTNESILRPRSGDAPGAAA
jgi:putative phosphoesterase